MSIIKYTFADGTNSEVAVNEDFYTTYLFLKKQAALIDRKETRRHQSLEKSLENGWDIKDSSVNIEAEVINRETRGKIHSAIELLTKKQRTVLILYVVYGHSFRMISEGLKISKEMVRKHYLAAIKSLKKNLHV